MARKTLLTESEIRRFMKLASMAPLGAEKLQEIAPEEMELDVDLGPEGGDVEDIEAPELEEPVEPEGLEVSITDEEADVLVDLGNKIEDVQGPPEEEVEEFETEEEPLGGGGEELGLPAEEEDVVPGNRPGTYQERRTRRTRRLAEDSEAAETARYSEDEGAGKRRYNDMLDKVRELEEHLHALKSDMSHDAERVDEATRQDDVVQEVARRVAARLAKENQQEEMVDHLAERIMARLVK